MHRFLLILSLTFMAATAQAASPLLPSQAAKHQLTYKVLHSTYGNIGTYTNTIEKNGEGTKVTTEARLRVAILGVTLYRQDIDRVETWKDNRLVGFHGITTVNGEAVKLDGQADGDHFELMTPDGKLDAPADVRIANPWSRQAVEGERMLTPDRGRLEKISVAGMDNPTLRIGGHSIRTEHFQVLRGGGPRRYEIWLDEKGTPVQFSVVSPNDTITFTLMV